MTTHTDELRFGERMSPKDGELPHAFVERSFVMPFFVKILLKKSHIITYLWAYLVAPNGIRTNIVQCTSVDTVPDMPQALTSYGCRETPCDGHPPTRRQSCLFDTPREDSRSSWTLASQSCEGHIFAVDLCRHNGPTGEISMPRPITCRFASGTTRGQPSHEFKLTAFPHHVQVHISPNQDFLANTSLIRPTSKITSLDALYHVHSQFTLLTAQMVPNLPPEAVRHCTC